MWDTYPIFEINAAKRKETEIGYTTTAEKKATQR
jgi:hypothetical protein